MDLLNETCSSCMYKKLLPHPNTKEILTVCVRFPPKQHSFMANNGPVFVTAYPGIDNNTVACGEWDDGQDIYIEEKLPGQEMLNN